MAELGTEPSMEDILSSIKRIIAEEGDAYPQQRVRAKAAAPESNDEDHEEILELDDPIEEPLSLHAPHPMAEPAETEQYKSSDPMPRAEPMTTNATADPILSRRAEDATRGSLAALTRLVVKPEPGSDGTLEGLVRDLLRPMLSDWLDANMPEIVERMVGQEIARISGKGGDQPG